MHFPTSHRFHPTPRVIEYLKICRIDHWLKNIFILFGHMVAIVLMLHMQIDFDVILTAALSLIPACLIASANYILNEILDAPFDALHPSKKNRGIPAGKVKIPILWAIMAGLVVAGFALAFLWFNWAYTFALFLLLFSGFVYNVPPIRLKDRAYLDVIAESFNNPIRLWLGYYALVKPTQALAPLSIVLAWWSFGALLMTGKRYAEFRFIDNDELSGQYRKSFKTYTQRRLIMAMITYANLFCFCTGIAMASYSRLQNLVLVFPLILVAVIVYFHYAMSEQDARLEPEQLLKHPLIIVSTVVVAGASLWLLTTEVQFVELLHLLNPERL